MFRSSLTLLPRTLPGRVTVLVTVTVTGSRKAPSELEVNSDGSGMRTFPGGKAAGHTVTRGAQSRDRDPAVANQVKPGSQELET
jgi:hypothetical protein